MIAVEDMNVRRIRQIDEGICLKTPDTSHTGTVEGDYFGSESASTARTGAASAAESFKGKAIR